MPVVAIGWTDLEPFWAAGPMNGNTNISLRSTLLSDGTSSKEVLLYPAKCWGVYDTTTLVAAISGCPSSATEYRLRGFWVDKAHQDTTDEADLYAAAEAYAKSAGFTTVWDAVAQSRVSAVQALGYTIKIPAFTLPGTDTIVNIMVKSLS